MTDGIQQISDEALSRWICEKLEPLKGGKLRGKNGIWRTLHDFWHSDAGYDAPPPATAMKPRDMVNDPAMTLMLLEKMPHSKLMHDKTVWICESDWQFFHNDSRSDKAGRAVAESFALAQGYPETEREKTI